MKITQKSMAGTVESSDIQVKIEPNEASGIEIKLNSSVERQFGKQIRKVIRETLEGLGVESAKVIAMDKGALDCIIKARVQCAAFRAAGISQSYDWEVMS